MRREKLVNVEVKYLNITSVVKKTVQQLVSWEGDLPEFIDLLGQAAKKYCPGPEFRVNITGVLPIALVTEVRDSLPCKDQDRLNPVPKIVITIKSNKPGHRW